jgi:DNA-binding NarL/FixJ family response regulator
VCAKEHAGPTRHRKKVLVVDDHPLIQEGLTDLINKEEDICVCGSAGDMPEAIRAIKSLKPDVVTVDISLADASGLELMEYIRVQFPDLPVLALSMHEESSYVKRAIQAGAKGYITKREATKKVVVAIRKVLEHRCYLSEEMSEELLSSLVNNHCSDTGYSPTDRLTDRELEVFCLLGHGKGTREIAEKLYLSMKTIQTYRSRIKEKLNLKTSSEVLQHAFKWANGQSRA